MPDLIQDTPKKTPAAHPAIRGELIALAQDTAAVEASQTITIQVVRAGEFVDMNEKEFVLSADDLDVYVANSNTLLAQEHVPVELGHPDDSGAPAAAWYRRFFKKVVDGVEWICAEIELTALGAQSLSDQLYKYFSANIWLNEKTICGGGFVNRPAVTGQQPIGSLAQSYLQLKRPTAAAAVPAKGDDPMSADNKSVIAVIKNMFKGMLAQLEMSHEDRDAKIRKALRHKYENAMTGDMGMYPYPIATYDDRVIVSRDDKYFEIPYSFNADDQCELGEPVEVEVDWKPKAKEGQGEAQMSAPTAPTTPAAPVAPATAALSTAIPPAGGGNGSNNNSSKGGESNMPQPTTPAVTGSEAVLAAAREQMARESQAQLAEFDRVLAAERVRVQEQTRVEMQRKQDIATLAAKVTSGRHAFPQAPKDIETLLLSLTDADRQLVQAFLEKTHESGLVEFGERGSSAAGRGHKELAAFAKPLLREWLAKGGSAEEFFTTSPELGKADEYDLYEFQSAK